MAQKGSLKLVEKYQFDEKKFIKIEGSNNYLIKLSGFRRSTLTQSKHIL